MKINNFNYGLEYKFIHVRLSDDFDGISPFETLYNDDMKQFHRKLVKKGIAFAFTNSLEKSSLPVSELHPSNKQSFLGDKNRLEIVYERDSESVILTKCLNLIMNDRLDTVLSIFNNDKTIPDSPIPLNLNEKFLKNMSQFNSFSKKIPVIKGRSENNFTSLNYDKELENIVFFSPSTEHEILNYYSTDFIFNFDLDNDFSVTLLDLIEAINTNSLKSILDSEVVIPISESFNEFLEDDDNNRLMDEFLYKCSMFDDNNIVMFKSFKKSLEIYDFYNSSLENRFCLEEREPVVLLNDFGSENKFINYTKFFVLAVNDRYHAEIVDNFLPDVIVNFGSEEFNNNFKNTEVEFSEVSLLKFFDDFNFYRGQVKGFKCVFYINDIDLYFKFINRFNADYSLQYIATSSSFIHNLHTKIYS